MLSLVVPIYRSEESIPALLDEIESIGRRLPEPVEAVFVVDGSPDHSFEMLRSALPGRGFKSRLVLLSRNFGAFMAIRAGLSLATGERMAVMAADLQEPPEFVLEVARILRAGDTDVVVGVRVNRADPLISRLASRIYWGLYRRFIIPEIPPGGVDMFGCTRRFRNQLLRLGERHSSLIAQVFWMGFKRAMVTYERRPRRHGRSAWTLGRKYEYLMDSIFSFTDLPLRVLVRVGGAVAFVSGLFGVLVAVLRLSGAITVPGYAAVVILVVFLGALNLFGLGIVGAYAWRTYENSKARPLHFISERMDFAPADRHGD